MSIEPGLVGELTHQVAMEDTAAVSWGERLPPVLSTPRIIGWMETAAHNALIKNLDSTQTSVGVAINVRHLAATPVGMEVRIRAELLEVKGRRLRFRVEAWDPVEKIAEGEIERAVIDWAAFTDRVNKKRGLSEK